MQKMRTRPQRIPQSILNKQEQGKRKWQNKVIKNTDFLLDSLHEKIGFESVI